MPVVLSDLPQLGLESPCGGFQRSLPWGQLAHRLAAQLGGGWLIFGGAPRDSSPSHCLGQAAG